MPEPQIEGCADIERLLAEEDPVAAIVELLAHEYDAGYDAGWDDATSHDREPAGRAVVDVVESL